MTDIYVTTVKMSKYYNLRSKKEPVIEPVQLPVSKEFVEYNDKLAKLIQYYDSKQEGIMSDNEEQQQLKEECFTEEVMDQPAPKVEQPKQLEPIEGKDITEEAEKVIRVEKWKLRMLSCVNLVLCLYWWSLIFAYHYTGDFTDAIANFFGCGTNKHA